MSKLKDVFVVAVLAAGAVAPIAEAQQKPIRMGATLAQTGELAPLGLNQLRGYQLCFKQMNDKGGVLGRKARAAALQRRVGSRHGRPPL